MNSCVLMARIVRSPQLRYTQDNQLAVTEMMVEFDNISPNNPPCTLKVIAWGNLATEVEQKYTDGHEVILTGRLKMDLVERQGYKEKIAELTISHIYPLGGESNPNPPSNVVNMISSHNQDDDEGGKLEPDESTEENYTPEGENLDNIPF